MFRKFFSKLNLRVRRGGLDANQRSQTGQAGEEVARRINNVFDDFALRFEEESESSRKYDRPLTRLTGRLNEDEAKCLLRHEMGYTHIHRLGEGCFGTVYKVRAPITAENSTAKSVREVSCKVFTFGTDWAKERNNNYYFVPRLECFKDEAIALRRNISHKYIRRYFGTFEVYCTADSTEQCFRLVKRINSAEPVAEPDQLRLLQAGLLMELVDGTLLDWKQKHQYDAMPEEQAKNVFLQIGEALVYLHEKHHLIHNDLKADNIGYVGDNGSQILPSLKLIDLGNARCFTEAIYKEAAEKSETIQLKDSLPAKVNFANNNIPMSHLLSGNPFGVESFLFGTMIIGLMTSGDDFFLGLEQVREKFIRSQNLTDLKFKKILVQMTDSKERVTVRWALKQYAKRD